MGVIKNREGEVIGSITFLDKYEMRGDDINHQNAYWLTRCLCGNESYRSYSKSAYHFRKFGSLSCGMGKCKAKYDNPNERKLYSVYKTRASYRYKKSFTLTRKEFSMLTKDNCYYCGSPPSSSPKTVKRNYNNELYIYNGIDRVDNSKGYDIDNCVTCCEICNRMKLDHSVDMFLNHIKKIIEHQK
jgi:hypothetical protein